MFKIFVCFLISILGGVIFPDTSPLPTEEFPPLTTQPVFPVFPVFPAFPSLFDRPPMFNWVPSTQPAADIGSDVRTLQLKVFILELELDILKYHFEEKINPNIKQKEYFGC